MLASIFAGCSQPSPVASPSPSLSAPPSPSSPAVATSVPGADITGRSRLRLGKNWGAKESYQGQTFRWVKNNPQILLSGLDQDYIVKIELEPGPGIATLPMKIRIASGATVTTQDVPGRMTITVEPAGSTIVLTALNGGNTIAADPRVLNFRVFRVATEQHIADPVVLRPIRFGKNWGVVEHYSGDTFRWIDNDAEFSLPAGHRRKVYVTAESGPGIGTPKFALDVLDASGKHVSTVSISSKQQVAITLPDSSNTFRFHVANGGKHIASDARVLNFRVFRLGRTPSPSARRTAR
jgi:hypothetical protein